MKSRQYISKKYTCPQEQRELEETAQEIYCHTCQHEVIDFTKMSSQEIIDFFQNRSRKQKTCGLLKEYQFKDVNQKLYSTRNNIHKKLVAPLAMASIIGMSSCASCQDASIAQQRETPNPSIEISNREAYSDSTLYHTISGQVVDTNNHALQGVYFELANESFSTDSMGRFYHEIPLETPDSATISTGYIGYHSEVLPLSTLKNKEIKITLREQSVWVGTIHYEVSWHKRLWRKITPVFRK